MNPQPINLTEAVEQVLAAVPPDVSATTLHHGYGTGLRNGWGLWEDKTPLSKWFIERGLIHADDKSGAILEAAEAARKGVPFDLDTYIARCHAHWKRYGIDEKGNRIPGHIEPPFRTYRIDKDGSVEETTDL